MESKPTAIKRNQPVKTNNASKRTKKSQTFDFILFLSLFFSEQKDFRCHIISASLLETFWFFFQFFIWVKRFFIYSLSIISLFSSLVILIE